ncbi:hypothetical protein MIS33_02425 [Wielerella bovis]|nr:hypothetical protein [Wielerella bovis]MCG7656415.1 hypothetical protein [Wielerella bovis]MCG7658640.1 hypothetical protein [Wielerella bovis]ULJ65167.1 hypothetical protein MIS33_02425 [Wielerella bovis]
MSISYFRQPEKIILIIQNARLAAHHAFRLPQFNILYKRQPENAVS